MKLSQKIVIYFLILITIGSFGYKDFILIDFTIHQDEIIAEHCVNKDKPELHCNGKCYLSKELKLADSKTEETIKDSQIIAIDLSWFVSIQHCSTFQPTIKNEQQINFDYYLDNYQNLYSPHIFQPPRC